MTEDYKAVSERVEKEFDYKMKELKHKYDFHCRMFIGLCAEQKGNLKRLPIVQAAIQAARDELADIPFKSDKGWRYYVKQIEGVEERVRKLEDTYEKRICALIVERESIAETMGYEYDMVKAINRRIESENNEKHRKVALLHSSREEWERLKKVAEVKVRTPQSKKYQNMLQEEQCLKRRLLTLKEEIPKMQAGCALLKKEMEALEEHRDHVMATL